MPIRAIIRPVHELTPQEKQAASEIDRIAFAGTLDDARIKVWATSEWLTLGFLEDQLVSVVGILVREVLLAGQPIRMGGIGGVATLPEWRRRGFSGALLDRSAEFLRDPLKVDFSFLVCAPEKVPFYARHGWQEIHNQVVCDQPEGKVDLDGVAMVLPSLQKRWTEGVLDLCGLPW